MTQSWKKTALIIVSCAFFVGAWFSAQDPSPATQDRLGKRDAEQALTPSQQVRMGSVSSAKSDKREQLEAQGDPEQDQVVLVRKMDDQDYAVRSKFGPLPEGLAGTAIPHLLVDQSGNLVINKSVGHFIEYFLVAAPSEGQQTAEERIREYFDMVLPEVAEQQALVILENYLAYRSELTAFEPSVDSQHNESLYLSEIQAAVDGRKQLRRTHLGEDVASALFKEQELFDDYSVNMVAVQLDDKLSDEEKDLRLAQLEDTLPAQIQNRVRYNRESANVSKKIKALQAEGGKEAEIYNLRESFYGKEVADRWAMIESDSPEWQERVASFNQVRDEILNDLVLSDEEKRRQVNDLRNQSFSRDEKLKLAFQSFDSASVN